MSDDEIWQQIVKVHNATKSLYIFAEEYDPNFSTFIQPNSEIKHAFDHVVRAKSQELGLIDKDPVYAHKNFDKALGHTCRAFFDTADWVSISLREKVRKQLRPYSNECISEVLPDYYADFQPKIELVTNEIAQIRQRKDIGSCEALLGMVEKYNGLIGDLLEIEKKISASSRGLVEYRRKERAQNLMTKFGWPIIVAILGGLLAWQLTASEKVAVVTPPQTPPPAGQ